MKATKAKRGRIYRRPSREAPGGYYMVPASVTLASLVERLRAKKALTSEDWSLLMDARRTPAGVLLKRYLRGVDPMAGGQRWEISRYVIVPGDRSLREVKERPGYKGLGRFVRTSSEERKGGTQQRRI